MTWLNRISIVIKCATITSCTFSLSWVCSIRFQLLVNYESCAHNYFALRIDFASVGRVEKDKILNGIQESFHSFLRLLCGSIYAAAVHPSFIMWPSCRPPLLTNWPSKKKYWRIKAHHNFLQIYYSSAKDASAQKMILGGMEWYA